MIWYFIFLLLSIGILLSGYGYYTHRKTQDWLEIFTEKPKRVFSLKLILTGFVVVTVLCSENLWKTADCTIYANSLKTTGTYSWWYGECNLEPTKNGLIPKSRIRGSTSQAGDANGD